MTATKFEQTHISMILDRSGSMSDCREATIIAVNKYLNEARKDDVLKEADFDLTIFDSNSIDSIRQGAPINVRDISADDFVPRGGTPLYDAIGRGIDSLDGRLAKSGSGKGVLVIATDGEENSSTKHTHESISSLIKDRQAKGWLVVFLGAGLDAARQGTLLGIRAQNTANIGMDMASLSSTMSYAASATRGYASNASTQEARSWLASGASDLTDEDRKSMGDETAGAGLTAPTGAAMAGIKVWRNQLPKRQDQSDAWANKSVDRDAWSN